MAKKLKIMAVCGFGIGTSLILKIKIDEVLKKHDINAESFTCDVASAGAEPCDICFTSKEISEQIIGKAKSPIIVINNFLDIKEIEDKGIELIKQLSQST